MSISQGNKDINKISIGSRVISKISIGNVIVYSAGNTVTYHVDTNVVYQEEVDADETVLSPKTFTPIKEGWQFVGWRQDKTASASVLNSLTMGDDPITLYAVFRQAVTVTYYNGNTTKQTSTGYRYYNNGDIVNPTFTIAQATLSGWTARGWSTATTGNGAISYGSLSNTEIASSITLYGMYYQTITLTLYNGSATASKPTGTRYYNPGSGAIVNPTFTVAATSISGWSFRGWSIGSTANGAISYTVISNTTFSSNTTLWGLYQQTITLSYNGNGNTGGSTAAQTGIRYYSSAGTYVNPSFTVAANGFAKTGYSFAKWRLGSTSGTAYSPGNSVALTASSIMYAEWTYVGSPFYIVQGLRCKQTLTWSFVSGENCNSVQTVNFTAGSDDGTPGVISYPIDNTKSIVTTARSANISTKGNRTLSIIPVECGTGSTGTNSCPCTVNGVTKTISNNGETTFDISGQETINITIQPSVWGYGGYTRVYFASIRLY